MATDNRWYKNINSPASKFRFDNFLGISPFSNAYKDILQQLNLFQDTKQINSGLKCSLAPNIRNNGIYNVDSETFSKLSKIFGQQKIDLKFLNDIAYLVTVFQSTYVWTFLNESDREIRVKYEKELAKLISALEKNKEKNVAKLNLYFTDGLIETTNSIISNHLKHIILTELHNIKTENSQLTKLKPNLVEIKFAISALHYLIVNQVINVDNSNLAGSIIIKRNFILIQKLIECTKIPFIETPSDLKKYPVYINKSKAEYWDSNLHAVRRYFAKTNDIQTLLDPSGWDYDTNNINLQKV